MAGADEADVRASVAGIATRGSLADGSVRELPSVVAIADLVCDAATTTEGQSPSSPSNAPETTPGREPGTELRAHTPVRWGRFRVLAPLGSGGYGEVHRAHDIELDREVALKLLKPTRSDRDHTLRLLEEARMLAQVRHPNVASVYGVGEHDGRVGFWMELVHGATLEKLLRTQGPRGAGEAALVGRDLCRALAAVHGAGLVHGDVKTSNVMRETGGRIVLMDFGAGGCRGRENGRTMGTPPYTAPEVRSGDSASALSDIYSLGVVLFRLVTAAYPGKAVSFGDLAEPQECGPALSLQDLRPDLPDAFVSVVEQAIASEPGERPQTAGTLHAALCGVLGVPVS